MADKILTRINENRREFVKRLLGASFAAPVVATFSLEALSTSMASAQNFTNMTSNQFCSDSDLLYGSGLFEGPIFCAPGSTADPNNPG